MTLKFQMGTSIFYCRFGFFIIKKYVSSIRIFFFSIQNWFLRKYILFIYRIAHRCGVIFCGVAFPYSKLKAFYCRHFFRIMRTFCDISISEDKKKLTLYIRMIRCKELCVFQCRRVLSAVTGGQCIYRCTTRQ